MLPFSPGHLLFLIVLLGLIVTFIQVGILTFAFEKLGLSANSALTLLLLSLVGSIINLPLFSMRSLNTPPTAPHSKLYSGLLRQRPKPYTGRTAIAINVGGALIPLFMSIYLMQHSNLDIFTLLLAVSVVSCVCYVASKPIPGLGIAMPIFIAPLCAALVGLILGGSESAPLAYICGTLGVLIGADILRLRDIQSLGTPIASIGGAGTFDGIFFTGIIAALLA